MISKVSAVAALVAFLVIAPAARADLIFHFDPVDTFTGTAPAGSLTADFSDVAGGVQLVITSSLASGENLDPNDALYFNFDPSDDAQLAGLTFALTANSGFSQAATVDTGVNAFKADGDGKLDILFTYTPSTKAYTTGESQTYLISGFAGLTASDFDFSSFCGMGCGTGSHLAAVHVQNTPAGGNGSAFTGATTTGSSQVPEPASLALLAGGMLGLGVMLRRRLRQRAA